MSVIYEAPERDVDYTAFVRERDLMRTQAWQRVADARATRDLAVAEAVERARTFAAEMRESAQRAGTYGIGERIRIRSNEKKMRVDLQHEAEREYAVIERHYYSTWGHPGSTRSTDAADYRQAVIDAYDRDGIDPVLRAVPRSRRHVDANGWSVYTTKSMLHGTRELLRTIGDLTYVRGTDDTVIRAAVALAASRSRNPLKFNGSAAFVARAQEIAHELGVATVGAAAPTVNTISTDSPDSVDATVAYTPHNTSPPDDVSPQRDDLSPDLIERGRRAAAEARGEVADVAAPEFGASFGVEPVLQDVSAAPQGASTDAAVIASQLSVDRDDVRAGIQLGEPWSTDGTVLADGVVNGQRYIVLSSEFGALVLPVPEGVDIAEQEIGSALKVRCDDSGICSGEVYVNGETVAAVSPDAPALSEDAPIEAHPSSAPSTKESRPKKTRGGRS